MVSNFDVEEGKSAAFFAGNDEKKTSGRKTSFDKLFDAELTATTTNPDTEPPASLPSKKGLKLGSTEPEKLNNNANPAGDSQEERESPDRFYETKSESSPDDEKPKKDNEKVTEGMKVTPERVPSPQVTSAETPSAAPRVQNKSPAVKKPTDTAVNAAEGRPVSGASKTGRPRSEVNQRRPSEIPKLKSLLKAGRATLQKPNMFQSKLPVKTTEKESEAKQTTEKASGEKTPEEKAPEEKALAEKDPEEKVLEGPKSKADLSKVLVKSYNVKKDSITNDKVKQALAENFNYLVPLYEAQFKKISEVWVNTIYCSLTMRTNLVKLLFQAFPNINRTQFYTESDRVLHFIAHAKNSTKLEEENLVRLIQNLVASWEKTKEEYGAVIANKEIADCYNHDWRKILKKITGVGEETKHLQMETPQLQKKKEVNELTTNEKIRRMEINLSKKEDEIKKLAIQLSILKENSFGKDSVSLKALECKELKENTPSLTAVQKEYEELKAKYLSQNCTYEKKIKDLENLVEEKKKVLEKERDMKKQLQAVLNHLQAQQKRLNMIIGKEQVDYVMGRSVLDRHKRREQLWLAAVKLVLRGFIIQLKKLERDRNKMLLEVHSNDFENFTEPAHILQKDNFIKSIKQQMNDLQKMCNKLNKRSMQC